MSLEPQQHRGKIFRIFKNRKAIHNHEDRRTASARAKGRVATPVLVLLQAVLALFYVLLTLTTRMFFDRSLLLSPPKEQSLEEQSLVRCTDDDVRRVVLPFFPNIWPWSWPITCLCKCSRKSAQIALLLEQRRISLTSDDKIKSTSSSHYYTTCLVYVTCASVAEATSCWSTPCQKNGSRFMSIHTHHHYVHVVVLRRANVVDFYGKKTTEQRTDFVLQSYSSLAVDVVDNLLTFSFCASMT